jgi:hypothetical protein
MVWQFGLGFICSIKIMYLSIIYVCRLWNGGVFYKKGFEALSFIIYK